MIKSIILNSENPTGLQIDRLLSYEPSTGEFFWKRGRGGRRRGQVAGGPAIFKRGNGQSTRYWVIRIHGHPVLRHRLVWAFTTGEWIPEIDHRNGDSTKDVFDNLRAALHDQNMQNSKKRIDNKSGFKGVSWDSINQKWVVRIRQPHGGEFENLGRFDDPAIGHQVYQKRAIELYGEFARFG